VWVNPDPAKRVFAIERPLWEMQVEKGLALYTYACAMLPDKATRSCAAQQSTLQDFMDTYKAVLVTFASFPCDAAAPSYVHISAMGDGATYPLIKTGIQTGGTCTKVGAGACFFPLPDAAPKHSAGLR
jgi:hypothetical protein